MLKSEVVTLRAVEPTDADLMYDVENDVDSWRYGETIAPLSRNVIRDYALNYDGNPFTARQLRLIITTTSDSKPVGVADLYDIDPVNRNAFIGIYILPGSRRCHIASQALKLLEGYSFKLLRLRNLAAKVESGNLASSLLFSNLGFIVSGRFKSWFIDEQSRTSDMLLFTKSLAASDL